jgi:hypothetical protein
MPELGSYGSVRGARGNSRPYRESSADSQNDAIDSERTQASAIRRLGGEHAQGRQRRSGPSTAPASPR